MRFTVDLELVNDAFQPDAGPEIARLLRAAADRLEHSAAAYTRACRLTGGPVLFDARDMNGNRVGDFGFRSSASRRARS